MNRTRAVLYARSYSEDESQAEAELQEQLDVCRKFAEEKGLKVVAELAAHESDRNNYAPIPHWDKIMEMAEGRNLNYLVVTGLEALGYTGINQFYVELTLAKKGVEAVWILHDHPSTEEGALNRFLRKIVEQYEMLKMHYEQGTDQ